MSALSGWCMILAARPVFDESGALGWDDRDPGAVEHARCGYAGCSCVCHSAGADADADEDDEHAMLDPVPAPTV